MRRQRTDPSLILICERDQNVRDLQKFFLEQAGFAVEFVDDGEAALARVEQASPACVVTEILIPKVDGLSLCRRLRDEPLTRDIPVMVFSILGAETRAGEAGANAFLRKPLVASTFVAAVRDLVVAQPTDVLGEQWATN